MRRFLIGLLASIGGLCRASGSGRGPRRLAVPAPRDFHAIRILLTADWRDETSEAVGRPDLLSLDFRPRPSVTDIVLALDAAAADPRVAGLRVELADTANGLGATQELRAAVTRFRAAGKYAIAYAETFGELSSGNEGYYLATAFDEIELQRVGLVGLTGLGAQVPLARELLASLGIDFEVLRRAEYKTALESLTDSQLTGPNREQLDALLDTLNGQFVYRNRRRPQAAAGGGPQLIDRGPFSSRRGAGARLVDATPLPRRVAEAGDTPSRSRGGRSPSTGVLRRQLAAGRSAGGQGGAGARRGPDPAWRRCARHRDRRRRLGRRLGRDRRRPRPQRHGAAPGFGRRLRGGLGDDPAKLCRRCAPHGKPVVVSMSNTAASGGYWIATAADRIVAQPAP